MKENRMLIKQLIKNQHASELGDDRVNSLNSSDSEYRTYDQITSRQ